MPDPQLLSDRYALIETLGQGGMAVVWRAEDRLLGRTVAVKILRDQYAQDPEFLARFRSEARSAAALNDPGVVAVYDVGSDGGRHYLVMELVDGQDLKQVIRQDAPLAAERVVRIGAELARAVGQAHKAGLVHRDIKPQNVLVAPDGRMKVADFGIARAVAEAGLTAPGIVLGTVHYLSPEQAAGQTATPASDVYALGVVLYEMLTGELPFTADSGVGVAMKILREDPRPLAEVNPDVPDVLARIVARAMAREPQDRFPDANVLADALQAYREASLDGTMRHPALVTAPPGTPPGTPLQTPPNSPGLPAGESARLPSGPLLDRTGLLLGLVALIALLGLIPLWQGLLDRIGQPPVNEAPQDAPLLTLVAEPAPAATIAQVAVPAVEGLAEVDAQATLEAMGLRYSSEYQTDPTVPKDQVLRQVPAADAIVDARTVVKLVVSGSQLIQVPELSGTEAVVSQQLASLGFIPRPRYRWNGASATEGQVIAIEQASLRMPAGSVVDLVVDGGPYLQMSIDFADNLFLAGVLIDRKVYGAGSTVNVTPRWEAPRAIGGDYAVRAELWGPDGAVVARAEAAPPAADGRPTSAWAAGDRVAGRPLSLTIPADAASGVYGLWLDVYPSGNPDAPVGIRQSAGEALVEGSRVRLMVLQVEAAEAAPASGEAATAAAGETQSAGETATPEVAAP
ncbi:MAG: protein kinase [Ardenticatenia bacterium]|nr:protein kinase [Ardenticatenia bacterium]